MDRTSVLAVLGATFECTDDDPPGLAEAVATDPGLVARVLVEVAGTMLERCRTNGVALPLTLASEVGELMGDGAPIAYIGTLLEDADGGSTPERMVTALQAEETDVESVLFVLLIILVIDALALRLSVRACLDAVRSSKPASPPARLPEPPTASMVATGLILPSLMAGAAGDVARATPPPGFDIHSTTGPSPDPGFEKALLSHLQDEVATRALRQVVADRCGVAFDDPTVERVCALAGDSGPE